MILLLWLLRSFVCSLSGNQLSLSCLLWRQRILLFPFPGLGKHQQCLLRWSLVHLGEGLFSVSPSANRLGTCKVKSLRSSLLSLATDLLLDLDQPCLELLWSDQKQGKPLKHSSCCSLLFQSNIEGQKLTLWKYSAFVVPLQQLEVLF